MNYFNNSEGINNNIKTYDNISNNSNSKFIMKDNNNMKKGNNINSLKNFLNGNRRYIYEYTNNFDNNNTCSMDIGGTLIKIVYASDSYVYDENEYTCNKHLEIKIGINKYIYLKFFKINELEEALTFLIKNNLTKNKIILTGGGSHKYFYTIIEKLILHRIIKEVTFSNKLYISKQHYCEKSSILHIEVCLNNSGNEENIFNEKCFSGINCETVKIYLSKSNKNEISTVESEKCTQKKNIEHNYLNDNQKNFKNNLENDMNIKKNFDNIGNENNVKNYNNYNYKEKKKENDNISDSSNEQIIFNGELILECSRRDEMKSIINGIHVLYNVKNSIVRYDFLFKTEVPVKIKLPFYPFLIANIGSGVSILKSEGFGNFKRIGGTAIGGGTFMGLAQMILGEITFEELIMLAEKGTSKLDLKVKNLRGDTSGSSCLSDQALASSFGFIYNIYKNRKNYKNKEFNQDIAKSLILMVSYNIGYLIYLLAKIHNVKRIFFSGKYISNCEYIMESLTYGVYYYYFHYHSRRNNSDNSVNNKIRQNIFKNTYEKKEDQMKNLHYSNKHLNTCLSCDFDGTNKDVNDDCLPEVLFLKHDGYLGAIGCFFS
ncbi:pantothenate kinase, putative [Plasmodium gallinaceum]|uniref:Pantothenate kinase, putative n=1 Tax=Plasmodium gallinaceum TaxID=5849 RepID=A0A1J1GXI0_PLAGA|nr:pantothenate kinase, putative [Plasmodium gallinaceum]CRG95720.1 pantothenate kinase, putative [Plasmodium gallinaceum]